MTQKTKKEKKSFQMPHAYVIMLMIITFCTLLTWVMPAGSFTRVEDPVLGRMIVVPGSRSISSGTLGIGYGPL